MLFCDLCLDKGLGVLLDRFSLTLDYFFVDFGIIFLISLVVHHTVGNVPESSGLSRE